MYYRFITANCMFIKKYFRTFALCTDSRHLSHCIPWEYCDEEERGHVQMDGNEYCACINPRYELQVSSDKIL